MGQMVLAIIAGWYIAKAYYVYNKESYISEMLGSLLIALVCLGIGIWKSLANF